MSIFWAALAGLYLTASPGNARSLFPVALIGLVGTVLAFVRYAWLRRRVNEGSKRAV